MLDEAVFEALRLDGITTLGLRVGVRFPAGTAPKSVGGWITFEAPAGAPLQKFYAPRQTDDLPLGEWVEYPLPSEAAEAPQWELVLNKRNNGDPEFGRFPPAHDPDMEKETFHFMAKPFITLATPLESEFNPLFIAMFTKKGLRCLRFDAQRSEANIRIMVSETEEAELPPPLHEYLESFKDAKLFGYTMPNSII